MEMEGASGRTVGLFLHQVGVVPSRTPMEEHVLSILCDPDTRFALELAGNNLRNTATGRIFPLQEGIPLFLSSVSGSNLKNQTFYDRIAPGYDLSERFLNWVKGKPDYRQEYLKELEIKPGARVLEVAVGTGSNLPLLPSGIDFFGIDLSWGMLKKCQRNLQQWSRQAHLFQGEAERLPFKVEAFDCVFHSGGINGFNDKVRAIKEMIWVARPGTKIVIVDELEKAGGKDNQLAPVSKRHVAEGSENVRCPIRLVPDEMKEVKAREICEGKMYCLTFRKP